MSFQTVNSRVSASLKPCFSSKPVTSPEVWRYMVTAAPVPVCYAPTTTLISSPGSRSPVTKTKIPPIRRIRLTSPNTRSGFSKNWNTPVETAWLQDASPNVYGLTVRSWQTSRAADPLFRQTSSISSEISIPITFKPALWNNAEPRPVPLPISRRVWPA